MQYGEKYDFIVKNHPRTDLGTSDEWADSYKIRYGDSKYLDCGKCLDRALSAFFEKDSIGRYIGILSGSLSTENFEYLGADVYFGGQPSSVYNGLSDEANIIFIITDSDGPVCGEGNTHFDYSAISGLYNSGLLNYKDENSVLRDTVFYNTGNTMKLCAEIADKLGDEKLHSLYIDMFQKWLSEKYPDSKGINRQGFPIK